MHQPAHRAQEFAATCTSSQAQRPRNCSRLANARCGAAEAGMHTHGTAEPAAGPGRAGRSTAAHLRLATADDQRAVLTKTPDENPRHRSRGQSADDQAGTRTSLLQIFDRIAADQNLSASSSAPSSRSSRPARHRRRPRPRSQRIAQRSGARPRFRRSPVTGPEVSAELASPPVRWSSFTRRPNCQVLLSPGLKTFNPNVATELQSTPRGYR